MTTFDKIQPAKRSLGILCALLATICWASNYLINRFFHNSISTGNVDEWYAAWLRICLGAIIFLPVTLTLRSGSWGTFRKNWKRDWKIFAFLSFCSVSEGAICFVALKYTTGARASLFANISPVFTLLISVLAAREVMNKRKALGVLLGVAGVILAAFSRGGDIFSGSTSMLTGDMMALISGLFWALFTVFGGVVTTRYNGAFCTLLYRLCGMIWLLPVLFFSGSEITLDIPLAGWLFFLYYALISGGIAIWLWSIAQKYVEPATLGSFGYLSAFSATAFSMIFLKEEINCHFIAAFILILGGMALAVKNKP